MAYIYVKNINKKPYYYLRISKRINGKVTIKDIAYLGDDVSKIEENLDKIEGKYKKEIRKGYKTIKKFIDTNYYFEKIKELKLKNDIYLAKEPLYWVEAAKMHFNEKFLKLDSETKKEVYKNFLIEFAYNTTSIEGNTITLHEANKLLNEDLTPKERTPREIFDLQNTEKAFFYLLDSKEEIGHELIIKMHDMLLENIDVRKGYRTYDIKVAGSHFDSSPAKYVRTDMDILIKWYNSNKGKIHLFALAAIFHEKFEKIHPFADGNGRTGRMLVNYMLLRSSYPPVIIRKKNRAEYLKAMSAADESKPSGSEPKYFIELIEYLAFEYKTLYWNIFNV